MKKIGILDYPYIAKSFTGGGGVNSNEIIYRMSKKYDITYFPKINEIYAFLVNRNHEKINFLRKNINIMEKNNIKVSNGFKSLIYKDIKANEIKKYLLNSYINESKNLELLYDNDYSPTMHPFFLNKGEIMYMSDSNKIGFGITLRGFSDINNYNDFKLINLILKYNKNLEKKTLIKIISFTFHPYFDSYLIMNIIKNKNLKFLGIVNNSIIYYNTRLNKISKKIYLLYPADASRFHCSYFTKDDYLLFYARLVPEKGLYEIALIINELKKKNIFIKTKIAGKFINENDKTVFYNLLKFYNIQNYVEFVGFLRDEDLQPLIEKAKILLYPSHSDAYSMVIIESLSLKTQVITYNIPSLYNLYKNMPSINFVKEYDVYKFANKIIDLLNEESEKYYSKFEDDITKKLIKDHSSYDLVFNVTTKMMDEYFLHSPIVKYQEGR